MQQEIVETNFEKGINLERQFCEYMKSDLGFRSARIRAQMKSKYNSRGSNVDIIGERASRKSKIFMALGIFYAIIFAILLMIGIVYKDNTAKYASIILVVAATISIAISFQISTEHAWVECKNQKGNVTYAQMQKTVHEYYAYRDMADTEFRFRSQYFVSGSGFAETALKLAKDKVIHCYIYKNGNFEEVSYWND